MFGKSTQGIASLDVMLGKSTQGIASLYVMLGMTTPPKVLSVWIFPSKKISS
jgi:hypothetical protein